MKTKAANCQARLITLFSIALFLASPATARADTLSDLYGTTYDRSEVIVAGEADDSESEPDTTSIGGVQPYSMDGGSEIATYSTQAQSVSPRYVSSEMLYFCKWESGQNYDQGLSWGDGYHAMGYFQFDNRYDLGSFLKAVYAYNPSKYSSLAPIGSRYGWNVKGATRSDNSFTQLGNDLNQAWHGAYAADPNEFSALQNDWAYTQYYDGSVGIRGSLRAMGIEIDNRADSVKSLVWGMANLFGQGGGSSYVTSGLYYGANWFIKNSGVNSSMDDATFVSTLCDYVINNVARRYSSQPEYWQGWQNRYRDEKSHYLSVLQRWVYEDGSWYLENASTGARIKGWQQVGGTWYWLDLSSGVMATSRTLCGDLWNDFASGGAWQGYANGWDLRDGSWYWLENGSRASGWRQVGTGWYWLSPNDNKAACNTVLTIGSKTYVFDSRCKMGQDGWCRTAENWYLLDSSGAMRKGWQQVGGTWYWLDLSSGVMATSRTLCGDLWNDFASGGAWQGYANGWDLRDGSWYWLENGSRASGWRYIHNSTWYYLDPSTRVMQTRWQYINGTWYCMDENGAMLRSRWKGNYYLLDSGAMARNQWIGPYYVDDKGCWDPNA